MKLGSRGWRRQEEPNKFICTVAASGTDEMIYPFAKLVSNHETTIICIDRDTVLILHLLLLNLLFPFLTKFFK